MLTPETLQVARCNLVKSIRELLRKGVYIYEPGSPLGQQARCCRYLVGRLFNPA